MKRIVTASLFLTLVMAAAANPTSGAPQVATYQNPIAYVGIDGNVYMTALEGTTRTALTTDGYVTPHDRHYFSSMFRYGGIHWSPDGSQFSFEDTVEHKLYVVRSGQGPTQVPNAKTSDMRWQSAISPDNTRIAYFNPDEDLVIMPVAGGEPTGIGSIGDSNPEKPDADPAEIMRANELASSTFNSAYILEWTKYGIVSVRGTWALTILGTSGKVLWETEMPYDEPMLPVISADRTRVLLQHGFVIDQNTGQGQDKNAVLNLADDQMSALPIPAEAKLLAWTPNGESVFFGTASDPLSVHDDNFSSFDFIENTLTLWQVSTKGGEPVQIFQRRGYAFGAVRVTPDGSALVFSLVTSSVNVEQAKLRKALPYAQEQLEAARPELIVLPLQKGAAPAWIALGGNPALGKGKFVVPVLPDKSVSATPCTPGLTPRLQIGKRATVIKDIRLFSQPLFYDTGYFVFMRLNPGKVVLVTAGPRCDDKGLSWWKVNYQGVVGWTLEGEAQTYWLEP